MNRLEIYRKFLGERLAEFNRSRGINRYTLHKKTGISERAIIDIEEGNTNYTIDTLLKYIIASDLYIFFGEKDKKDPIFDPADIAQKAGKYSEKKQ